MYHKNYLNIHLIWRKKKNIYNTDLEIKTVNLYNILFFTVDFVQVIYIL